MNYMWKFMSNFKEFYNEINSATLTGAIDVIVIQQEDGTYLSSPFHVRFGKIGVLRSREKVVDIEINGEPIGIQMKLGETGEAFFVEETNDQTDVPSYLATSPIPDLSNFEKEMDRIKSGGHKMEDDSGTIQIVNSNYSEGTVTICEFPDNTTAVSEDGSKQQMESTVENKSKELKNDMSTASLSKSEEVTSKTSENETEALEADKFSTKTKKKRRKRTLKRRSVTKAPDQVDQVSAEPPGVENSEDTGEDIFQMDVEDEIDSPDGFKQLIIPPTPSPQISQLSSLMRTEEDKANDWPALHYKSLQLPHNGECGNTAYSDGEITPVEGSGSPAGSRPSTPKSDTEYEMKKMASMVSDTDSQNQWSWTWGELPVPPQASPKVEHVEPFSDDDTSAKAKQIKKEQEQQRSMFGGMFKLMGMSRKNGGSATENTGDQGMYLDDLSSSNLDPEIAALYLSTNSKWSSHGRGKESTIVNVKDDDVESGHGSSLPQSPHSVEGTMRGLHQTINIDSDMEEAIANSELKEFHDVAFSLCGNVLHLSSDLAFNSFQKSIITYEQFSNDPNIINHPDLMVRIDGKYCNWSTAAPILMSFVLFQKPLPENVVNNLMKERSPKTATKSQRRSWFSWGRTPAGGENEQLLTKSSRPRNSSSKLDFTSVEDSTKDQQPAILTDSINIEENSTIVAMADATDSSSNFQSSAEDIPTKKSPGEMYKKSLRLSSKQIMQLNLKDGPNEVVFSVTTAYQGTTRCKCHIYLWRHDDQIVVSDIDGTITKSDVLGHILPIVGKSWAQSGVAQLFTNIKRNGYQFLYLSARAIGQARITRDYLRSIRQGDITLPEGPLLLSPSSLISALHREVIEKKPEEFKINCLRDIQALFYDRNPFYAGYGNKINDVWAYRAMGIPMSRIFTINHKGELKYELNRTLTFQSSYSNLSEMVDHLFPPLRYSGGCDGALTTDFIGAEEFSSFTYWREPLLDIEISMDSHNENEDNSKK